MSDSDNTHSIASPDNVLSSSLLIRTTHIVLLLMAFMYLLVFAHDILVPMVYGFFLSTLLNAPMQGLQKIGLPKFIAALLPLLAFFCALCACLYFSKAPAMEMGAKVPNIIQEIKSEMGLLTAEIDKVTEQAKSVQDAIGSVLGEDSAENSNEQVAPPAPAASKSSARSPVVSVSPSDTDYGDSLLQSIFHSLWLTLVTFLMCYFFLIGGEPLSRNIAEFCRTGEEREKVFRVLNHIRRNLSRYLAVALSVNLAFGLIVAALLFIQDVEMFWLWGLLAGLLRFIPYLGPLIALMMVTVASATAGVHMPDLFITPAGMLIMLFIFGTFVDPFAHSQRFKLNPIAIFVSIVFWSWIWGVAGTFIALPVLVVLVAICAEIERLNRFSYILCIPEEKSEQLSEIK